MSHLRLHDHTPCSHSQTHAVIAALRLEVLSAPAVLDGPMDSETFLAYVEQVLVADVARRRCGRAGQPGGAQAPEARVAIEGVAHVSHLPPYSPDFNPIEQAFAKLKPCLRAARLGVRQHFAQRRDRSACCRWAIAVAGPITYLPLARLIFILMGPAHGAYGYLNGRARDRLEFTLCQPSGTPPPETTTAAASDD